MGYRVDGRGYNYRQHENPIIVPPLEMFQDQCNLYKLRIGAFCCLLVKIAKGTKQGSSNSYYSGAQTSSDHPPPHLVIDSCIIVFFSSELGSGVISTALQCGTGSCPTSMLELSEPVLITIQHSEMVEVCYIACMHLLCSHSLIHRPTASPPLV